jgi:MFS family permease
MLVALLSINFGIVFFDRNALNFLMPFVAAGARLSNTQVACSRARCRSPGRAHLAIGYVSDRTGSRKGLLIIATLAFSACSFLSGIAASFVAMLAARLLMGVAEGGVMPISQTLIAAEVRPSIAASRRASRRTSAEPARLFAAPVLLVAFALALRLAARILPRRHTQRARGAALWRFVREPEVARSETAARG